MAPRASSCVLYVRRLNNFAGRSRFVHNLPLRVFFSSRTHNVGLPLEICWLFVLCKTRRGAAELTLCVSLCCDLLWRGRVKALRNMDRDVHHADYPKLCYPELYLLQGGYRHFHATFPEHCNPKSYMTMDDPSQIENFQRCNRLYKLRLGYLSRALNGTLYSPPLPPLSCCETRKLMETTSKEGARGTEKALARRLSQTLAQSE